MRDVRTGYVTCGAREDGRLPVVDGDEGVPMRRNGWLFMSGAKINAFVPAWCGNRHLSRPIRRNDRLILLWWAVVGRAAMNVNALSLFHMKQLRSPASYRRGRGALFYQPFPCRLQKRFFRFRPALSALLYSGFHLFTATRLIGRLITCAERSLCGRLKSGLADWLSSLLETPILALPYRAAKSHAFTVWGMTTTSLRYPLRTFTVRTDCFT